MSVAETTILLGQSNDFVSPKIKPETPSKKNEFGDKISFLLCEACYWCASYFNSATILTRCPTCGNDNVVSMPIANGEAYTLAIIDIVE